MGVGYLGVRYPVGIGYPGGRASGWLGYTHPEPQKRAVHILFGWLSCKKVRSTRSFVEYSNFNQR